MMSLSLFSVLDFGIFSSCLLWFLVAGPGEGDSDDDSGGGGSRKNLVSNSLVFPLFIKLNKTKIAY